MTEYAQNTDVPSDRSRAEIEKTLSHYGAFSFMYGWQDASAVAIGTIEYVTHQSKVSKTSA